MGLRRCERCHFAFELASEGEPKCPQCGTPQLKDARAPVREHAKTMKLPQVPLVPPDEGDSDP